MGALEHLRRMLEHDAWANREALQSLRAAHAPIEPAVRLLAHVAATERVWLSRLERSAASVPVWPGLDLDECAAWLEAMPQLWRAYLDSLAPADLDRPIDYRNTKGEPWSSTPGDILTHVVLHSSYHRGQIAALVRTSGETPAVTDYIHCIRLGLID